MRVGALIPIGFLIGALLSAHALANHPHAVATDLAQPLAVVTYWKSFGATMFFALLCALAVASAGYMGVLRFLAKSHGVDRRSNFLTKTALFCALSCVTALLFPVIFSSDVYAYAGYGDLALHGINPYAHARVAHPDPLLTATIWQWSNPPPMCVYGPVFVWIAQAIVALTLPLGVAAPLWALRILACAALVACVPLADAAFAGFPSRRRLAAAAGIALNPVAIWACAEGHNDSLVLAVALLGFALVQRSRFMPGAMIAALAASIKIPALAACFGLIVTALPDRERVHRIAGGVAIGLAVTLAISAPLVLGVRTHLAPDGKYLPQFSPQYALMQMLPLWASVALVCATALILCIAGVRRLASHEVDGWAFLTFGAWIAIPNPYPWYALWILPIAFLAWRTPAGAALIAGTLLISLRYYAEATSATISPPLGVLLTLLEFGLPAALLIAYMPHHARRGRPEDRTTAPDFARLRTP
jgi:hypothetical protein